VFLGTFQRTWLWRAIHVAWRTDQGIDPIGSENQEKADERNPDTCPPSQAGAACPNPGELTSDHHLAFPLASDEE
jgi:hypothetical protein